MFAHPTRVKFPRGGPLFDVPHASRILFRVACGVCVAAGTSTVLAISTGAAAAQAPGTVARTSVTPRSAVVTNLRSWGPGSLRAAIERADAGPLRGSTTIGFSVAGTITLGSGLPAISRQVTIDARSAPGYVSGGPPVLEIDFNSHAGLRFDAGSGGSRLLGVAVDNATGSGVTLNARSITLNDDYIGLDLSGRAFGNHGDGVYVAASSSGNFIGRNSPGASGVVANVISGNTGTGIVFSGSSHNTVVSNRIGTNPAGTSAIANGRDGMFITRGSDHNEIGGTVFVDSKTGQANNPTGDKGTVPPVFVVPPLGNLI
jgi:parallel beta-helix repeat protein